MAPFGHHGSNKFGETMITSDSAQPPQDDHSPARASVDNLGVTYLSVGWLPWRIAKRISLAKSGCWRVSGAHSSGYAQMTWKHKTEAVHRVVYELATGEPIPAGHTIDHVRSRGCTYKDCCNPEHLEAVTPSEQMRRQHNARLPVRTTYDPVTRTLPEDVPQVMWLMTEDRPR